MANKGRWISLACGKCGAAVKVQPVDESDQTILMRLMPSADDPFRVQRGPACPMCAYWRGGTYYLERVISKREARALDAFRAAAAALAMATEPEGPPAEFDEPPADGAPEAAWDAYDAAWAAYDAAADAYAATFSGYQRAQEALAGMGYPGDVLWEIEDAAVSAARKQQATEGNQP